MFFLLLALMQAVIVPLTDRPALEVVKKMKTNTVLLAQTKVYHRLDSKAKWMPVDNFMVATTLEIFESPDKQKASFDSSHSVHHIQKYESNNNFIFTTPSTTYYNLSFSVDGDMEGEYAIDCVVYEGRPLSPEIVSGADYQMMWLTKKMGDLLYFARTNFNVQGLDDEDEVEYVTLYNSIYSLVFKIIICKLLVVAFTLFIVNKKVMDFYYTKKIINK